MRTIIALIGVLGVVGCGGDMETAAKVGSCDYRQSIPGSHCIEYSGSDIYVMTYKSACSMGGVWSDAACEHAATTGGCKVAAGTDSQTVWYFSAEAMTAADVMTACTSSMGTFVAK